MVKNDCLRIGIVGSATKKTNSKLRKISTKLVQLIGSADLEIATGAGIGIPHDIILKAKKYKVKTIGFSPDPNSKKHKQRHDNAPLADFNKVIFYKGFSRRSTELILSCDAILVIGGRIGTLAEYALAFDEQKPIGVLTGTGGISDHLKCITELSDKHRNIPVFFSDNIEILFRKLLGYLKKDQWQDLAQEYNNYQTLTEKYLGYDYILDMMKKQIKNSKIIDYGCGSGKNFTLKLEKLMPEKIWAVDTSKEAIQLAKKSEKIIYKHIESLNLNFIKDGTADLAFANFVLCCMRERNNMKKFLREINKKMKINGELIIMEPNPDSPGYQYASCSREKPENLINGMPLKVKLRGIKTPIYDYWRPKKEYLELLKEARFELVSIKEPIITDSKEKSWKDERKQAPNIIIRARKI